VSISSGLRLEKSETALMALSVSIWLGKLGGEERNDMRTPSGIESNVSNQQAYR